MARARLRIALSCLTLWSLTALSTPTRAAPPFGGSGPVEAAFAWTSGAAATMGLGSLLLASGSFKKVKGLERGFAVGLYAGGALTIGFGSAAMGLQYHRTGSLCNDTCHMTYALGSMGVAFGVIGIASALFLTDLSPFNRPSRVVLSPVPLLIPTDRGPALGAGILGIAF